MNLPKVCFIVGVLHTMDGTSPVGSVQLVYPEYFSPDVGRSLEKAGSLPRLDFQILLI